MTGMNGFTEIQLRNRAKKFKELEAQIKALKEEQDALKKEMRADLETKGVESAKAGKWTIFLKTVANNRFDTNSFKIDHSDLYNEYFKVGTTKRFEIA